jgi:hypothetical protein
MRRGLFEHLQKRGIPVRQSNMALFRHYLNTFFFFFFFSWITDATMFEFSFNLMKILAISCKNAVFGSFIHENEVFE